MEHTTAAAATPLAAGPPDKQALSGKNRLRTITNADAIHGEDAIGRSQR